MLTLNQVISQKMENEEFKAAYDELQPEMALINALIDARVEQGLTQKDLASRSGVQQADISRLEHGKGNPRLRTLQKLAQAMGYNLQISFVRKEVAHER